MAILATPEIWVAISFIGFFALLAYFKVPQAVTKALDKRADEIRSELDEARRLREEAQALLAEYQRKQRDAEREAEDIVTQAREEAERYAAETRAKLEETLERRMQLADDKIAQAEAQAISDVRTMAADVAVAAATRLLGEELTEAKAKSLVEAGIKELDSKLN